MATRTRTTRKTIAGFAATRGRRDIMKQAASDLQSGQKDTDQRGAARNKLRRGRKTTAR